jgi:hypothetical protein
MISRTESQKIAVQTRNENIEIELDKSVFRSFLGASVRLQRVPQKDDFIEDLVFFNIRDN